MARLLGVSTYDEWFAGRRLHLLRLATNLCGDLQTAQDVLQDVSVRAHGRWDSIQRTDHPDAYLRRMVVNEFLSWRRRARRVILVEALTDRQVGAAIDHATEVVERHRLRRELDQLPPRQRAVLVLRYYEGLDDRSIADVLGTRPVTVRAYASRALSRLRIQLTDQPPEPGPPATTPSAVRWETRHAHR